MTCSLDIARKIKRISKAVTKLTDVKLHLGDCLDIMGEIPSKSVNLILTDLPYGTTYAKFDRVLKNNKKFKDTSVIDLDQLWEHYERILTDNGTVVLFAQQPFTSVLVMSNYAWFKCQWVWEKNRAPNFMAARYVPLKFHEDILVFSPCGINTGAKNPITYNPQGVENVGMVKERTNDIEAKGVFRYNSLKKGVYKSLGSGLPRTIIKFDTENGLHPTQKPIALCEYLIKTYSNERDLVLDSCMGCGTTGVAALNTKRRFIGIEKDLQYFLTTHRRIYGEINELIN